MALASSTVSGLRLAFLYGRVRRPTLVPFGDERRIRAELFDIFLNFLVKALDQRATNIIRLHPARRRTPSGDAQLCVGACLMPVSGFRRRCAIPFLTRPRACFDGIQLGRSHGEKYRKETTPVATQQRRITALNGVSWGTKTRVFTTKTIK